ncbi:MAG: amino acid permease [Candidatus Midichloria sp.]|nr:MAG: amino acid permease [Candidatus Midichloria sp.]
MNISKYFKRKSINELVSEAEESKDLVRSLDAFQLILFGIGAIVGAGIFVLAGEAASRYAGPAVTISFAISGLACVCAALCYAELSSMIPVSGSAYTYIYATLGELAACIMAGFMTLGSFLSIASVASGWSGYIQSLLADFGIYIPAQFSATTGCIVNLDNSSQVEAIFNLPAFFIVMLITYTLHKGIQTSAFINAVIVFLKMLVLFGFIIVGSIYIDTTNWEPFLPKNTGKFGQYGISGIIAGSAMVFFAYNGFDAVATAAQETKNPQRDLPIGILGSLIIATLTYVLVAGVLTGLVKYTELGVAQPIAIAVDKMGLPWFSLLAKVGATAGLTSVVLVMLYGLIRVLFVISKDGLLPAFFSKLHKDYKTPHILTIICGFMIAIASSTVSLDTLVPLANFGIIGTFAIVCFAALFLRYSQPNLKRNFRCPFMPIIPIAGMLILLQIMSSLPTITYFYALIWVSFIVLFYLFYGQFNSKLYARK